MDEISRAFILKHWSWSSPSTVKVASQLASNGITLDDLAFMLGITQEDLYAKLLQHPEIKVAYDMGPKYLEYQVRGKLTDSAMSGNAQAQATLLNMNKVMRSNDQAELSDIIGQIENAQNAQDMSLALRRMLFKRAAVAAANGEMKPPDIIRLLTMVADRTDGKVADKVEHSGEIGLSAILKEISGTTSGLPKEEWFDGELDEAYNNDAALALTHDDKG